MARMKPYSVARMFSIAVWIAIIASPTGAQAPGAAGTLEFTARVSATAAHPEPVRQFTFYLLKKSYAEIVQTLSDEDPLPSKEKYIDDLHVSPQLKEWLRKHEILDLTAPDVDQMYTADDIMSIPEFREAYTRANSGGVTPGLPHPKFKESDRETQPEKYERQVAEYEAALHKFIAANHSTTAGMDTELASVNPQTGWSKLQADHNRRLVHMAPGLAQTRYFVAKTDTDLDGRAAISGIPPGKYWLSTLELDAPSGDTRLHWDVEVHIEPGQTTHVELTNLNAVEFFSLAH